MSSSLPSMCWVTATGLPGTASAGLITTLGGAGLCTELSGEWSRGGCGCKYF